MFIIRQLKFYRIKYQKSGFLINRVDSSDLSNKLFPIAVSCSALLCTAANYVCLLVDVIGIILIPVECIRNVGSLSWRPVL